MIRYVVAGVLVASCVSPASAQQVYDILWYHHDDLTGYFPYTDINVAMDYSENLLTTDDDGAALPDLDHACNVDLTMSEPILCYWTYWLGDAYIGNKFELGWCFDALDRQAVAIATMWNDALGASRGFWWSTSSNPPKMVSAVFNTPTSGTTIAHELGHQVGLIHTTWDKRNIMTPAPEVEFVFGDNLSIRRNVDATQKSNYDNAGPVYGSTGVAPPTNDSSDGDVPYEG